MISPGGQLVAREPVFMRPCSDEKPFAGFVIAPEDLRQWQEPVLASSDGFATPNNRS